jgi:hypothetical protein
MQGPWAAQKVPPLFAFVSERHQFSFHGKRNATGQLPNAFSIRPTYQSIDAVSANIPNGFDPTASVTIDVQVRVARFFFIKYTKTGENVLNNHETYQMATKYPQ